MVKKVVITNYLGESVEYDIEGVDVESNNGLFITEIEGLGPTGADLIFTNIVSADGSLYNSGKLNKRNIVIKARFINAKTIEEARLSSYKFFPLNKPLEFVIETDNRRAHTVGYVEKNEPNIFSDTCDVQISVLCEKAVFDDDYGTVENSFTTIEPLFEFVYENEGNTLNTEFGNKSDKTVTTITNKGDVPVGYIMDIVANFVVTSPTIQFVKTNEFLTFETFRLRDIVGDPNYDFGAISGDTIELCTIEGKKSCYLITNGIKYNILHLVSKTFSWPKLDPGYSNQFHIYATGGEDNLRVFIKYQAAYEGV